MHTLRFWSRAVFAAAVCFACVSAQGQGTRSDYERAAGLRNLTKGKLFKTKVAPHWLPDNARFWYRNDLPDGAREFILVDAEKGVRRPAFDHGKLAESLAGATGKPCLATHLPVDAIELAASGNAVYFRALGKHWKCSLKDYSLAEGKPPAPPAKEATEDSATAPKEKDSPPGEKPPANKWSVFVKDHNLHLRAKDGGEEFPLTRDGQADDAYQGRVYWSPDFSRLVALQTKKAQEHKVYMIESSPKDQVQPKLHSHNYLKPGDRIAVSKPHLFDVARRKEIPISDELFSNPWSIGEFRWSPDGRRFTFAYNQRGHQVLRIVSVDGQTGEAAALIDEQSKTFIDYAFKRYVHYMDATDEIIWMSERDGYNHLHLVDSRTGQVKNQITKGPWAVRGVDRVDDQRRQIWFRAGGIYPEQDPYYIHYCRVNFDGGGLLILTAGNGTHSIQYSPDRRFILDTYSRVDMPPVTELRRTRDGKRVCGLECSDPAALLATGWKMPERFVAKGRDGETNIYGVIFRPTNFDPKKKYPVIEKIYAGPHGSFVPKRFGAVHGSQAMAELGFILVQIDGMGTSHRSKAFHDVCWKNLGDSGFPDRILWIQAAAKKYPYMDIARVGIYGGSAGGQSAARAVFAFGDFYKVAVADCGCHDNRMDKIWWNEAWMGWPIGPHYAEQSNVTCAHQLKGKLLLIVGELDRNVDPASTMQVVNALIEADKPFDLLVIPGANHTSGGEYGQHKRIDFFVEHLLGNKAPRWAELAAALQGEE